MTTEVYTLGRRAEESERLDTQHEVLCKINGFYLHPDIVSKLPKDARIADIGTGTGVFLLRLHQHYPEGADQWRLEGFDVSADQFPPANSVSENMTFSVHDIRNSFPEGLKNQFDLVHVRLLSAALSQDEWRATVTNVLSLLKSGGALQWTEGDIDQSAQALFGPNAEVMAGLREFAPKVLAYTGGRWRWARELVPQLLRGEPLDGFQVCTRTAMDAKTRRDWSLMATGAHRSGLKRLADAQVAGAWTHEEVDTKYRKACEDIENGAWIRGEFYTYIGWKR